MSSEMRSHKERPSAGGILPGSSCEGGIRDIHDVGLREIHQSLPNLILPSKIRLFWQWFFNQPEIRKLYGNFNTSSEELSA